MNTRTSLIATAASLALFTAANGQVVIDITGSTAGRSTVDAQIKALLTGETVGWYTTDDRTAASSSSCDGAIYKGGTILVGVTPTAVTVRTFWAGSASGVDFVSNQVQLNNKLIATSFVPTGVQVAAATVGLLAPASAETVSEFGFSDVKQAATVYQTNPLAESTDMFVIPFLWLRTADLSNVSNITSQMIRGHYAGLGETPESLFTGNALHTDSVFAVGRDDDSGTRITAFAESGVGAFASVSQWSFTVAGTQPSLTISSPVEVFNGGFASGGSVGNILSATGAKVVGYVGISDGNTAIGNGAVALNYNGVPFSIENVKNGSYTYWSKYQALRKQTLTGASASLFSSLKTALIGAATAGNGSSIKLTDMKVDRQADGSDVLPK